MNDKDIYCDNIKQEPDAYIMNTSASVPIPTRKDTSSDYRDFGLDFENSPIYNNMGLFNTSSNSFDDNTFWHQKMTNNEALKSETLIHMDDDDIFQVDKADLFQGPTLAELNANDDTLLLSDLNFDDLLLPNGQSYISLGGKSNLNFNNNIDKKIAAMSYPRQAMFYKEVELPSSAPTTNLDYVHARNALPASSSVTSSSSSLVQSPSSPQHVAPQKSFNPDDLLKQENYMLGQSVPSQGHLSAAVKHGYKELSRLSSSAPTHLGLEQIWQRREPRKHLLSTSSLAEAGSTSSISTGGLLSPDPQDLSHEEGDTDEESDVHYEDFSSDGDSTEDEDSTRHSSKRERFFWQYNVQAKGPKGQRLVTKVKLEDPHVLHEVADPVFSPDCSLRGIKHSGKARKGDGNDLTPNPRKLNSIGKELDILSRTINDMTPVNELPFNVRPTSRKEKNKLASRACRLKKKAQHEANKIKLSGLEIEHKLILNSIEQAKQILIKKFSNKSESKEEVYKNLEKLVKNCQKVRIAGQTTEYVNKIIEKYRPGSQHVTIKEDKEYK